MTTTATTTTATRAVLARLGAKLDTLELTTVERAVLDAIIHTAADTPDTDSDGDDEVSGFGFKPSGYRDRMSTLGFTCVDDLAKFTATDDLTNLKTGSGTDRNIMAGSGNGGI